MRPLICILLVASAALAQDAAAPLARNAWYWQARARSDKAEEAWKNVLKVAPENAEALAALGGFAARSGRLDEARSYLARLVKANPKHPEVAVLQREVTLGPRFGPMLIAARKLVHEGKHAQGAAKYAELFGEAGPPGDLALEYYQTL
ncbi:MAG: tetratricopeptide repeat protein, partial [Myxococcales bacterium]